VEFLVYMELGPIGMGEEALDLLKQEAERARQLAQMGIMRRLWRVPGRRANWGIWNADTIDELHNAIASLPLYPHLTVTVHPLAHHPNDPGLPLRKHD
jgi:muconolactone delta-isomerase